MEVRPCCIHTHFYAKCQYLIKTDPQRQSVGVPLAKIPTGFIAALALFIKDRLHGIFRARIHESCVPYPRLHAGPVSVWVREIGVSLHVSV